MKKQKTILRVVETNKGNYVSLDGVGHKVLDGIAIALMLIAESSKTSTDDVIMVLNRHIKKLRRKRRRCKKQ